MKDKLPPRTLEAVRYARAKYVYTGFLLRLHRELKKSNHPSGRLAPSPRAIRSRTSPQTTVLFFPESPSDRSMAFNLCTMLGYAITTDPDGHWDVAFKWQDTTFFDRSLLDRLPQDIPVINRGSVDISKTAVDRAMQQVFGYSARIDPTQYIGPAVQKSDLNGTHDGQIIDCPVPEELLRPGYVYQKLIDSALSTDIVGSFRVPLHGQRIPVVYLFYRPVERRFGSSSESRRFRVSGHRHFAEPHDVFSKDELKRILAFARHIGLDFGALDILRDKADGRIYIIDANNTPGGRGGRWPRALKRAVRERLAQSFAEMVQESRRSEMVTT